MHKFMFLSFNTEAIQNGGKIYFFADWTTASWTGVHMIEESDLCKLFRSFVGNNTYCC